jgi:hypothetical protein
MFTEFKFYSLLLIGVPVAFIVSLATDSANLSGYEWANAVIYSLLCLAAGMQLWLGKMSGYWLSVISFGLASFTLEVGNTYIAAAYFLPNFTFTVGSTGIEPTVFIGFSWIPLAIFLYLIFSGKKAFNIKHNKAITADR